MVLSPLDPVDRLDGVGGAVRTALAEHGIQTLADLAWTAPSGWDDLRSPLSLSEAVAKSGERCVFVAEVKSASILSMRGRRTVRVLLTDGTCTVHAFWFFLAHGIMAIAKPKARVLVIGKITSSEPKKPARTAHPEIVLDTEEARVVRPRYPRLGPKPAILKKAIANAVREIRDDPNVDPVPAAIALRESMPPASALLSRVHGLSDAGILERDDKRAFMERLAWAEVFTRTWERLLVSEGLGAAPARSLPLLADSGVFAAFGFAPTKDQAAACEEISRDLVKTTPMRRLLLGDVGTGKTAVALHAIAQCVAAKRQAVILAPTSVLAEQYRLALKPLEKQMRIAFVAGGLTAAERKRAEEALAKGEADVAVGTHALLNEGVAIPKLALVVVDEQQRLGVGQRLQLVRKGESPHLLTLSATPIPRTLSLALRGELQVSTLRELPLGRSPTPTAIASKKTADVAAIVKGVKEAIDRGERVFWIVPRVGTDDEDDDDAEPDDLASANARAKALRAALGGDPRVVTIVHGRLSPKEKRDAMTAFRDGSSPVLVATTVVEVGVDVAEATLMVIEDADRFGLAQLHQLRGRVGRGGRPGACILLVQAEAHGSANLNDARVQESLAMRRLTLLTQLTTGEDIARADLELRGAGDLGGTRQHGVEDELVYLDAGAVQHPWLERIEKDARHIRKTDPDLTRPEHAVLRSLLDRLVRSIAMRIEAG